MNNKYTTTPETTVAEALNNMVNECAHMNEFIDTVFKMVMAEKAAADARHVKYEAEETKREAERKAEHEMENLKFHLGNKLEVLELGEKSDNVKVGDVLEIVKIDLTSWNVKITVQLGNYTAEYEEDVVKKMIARGWIKLV